MTQRNWMELRAGVTLSALGALATQFGGLREGRKSILFFSQGPPVRPGSPNDQRYKEAMEAANRGNVTIHVIDPRPLGSVGFGGDDILRRIAYDTGGRAIVSTNDPKNTDGRDVRRERLLPGGLHADPPRQRRQVPRDQGSRGAARLEGHCASRLLGGQREGDDRRRRSGRDTCERGADNRARGDYRLGATPAP